MPPSFATTLRNARADQITAAVGSAALLRLYTANYGALLSEHVCGIPFAPAAVNGVLTWNPIATAVAVASGTATLARIYQSGGTTIILSGLTVGDQASTADIRLLQSGTVISQGFTVVIDSATSTEGNV